MRTTRKLGLFGVCAALLSGPTLGQEFGLPRVGGATNVASPPIPPPTNLPGMETDPIRVAQAPAGPATPAPTTPAPLTAPPATQPNAASNAFARANAANSATGRRATSAIGRFNSAPIMLGDMAPLGFKIVTPSATAPPPPPTPGLPPTPPTPNQPPNRRTVQVPWVRGFKIADNQSPAPQDRFFFTFNYFNDLNGTVNRALGSGVDRMQLYRELFGFEKTFFGGDASIGFRLPLNSLTTKSSIPGLGGTTTALGNMTVYGKYVLWRSEDRSDLISAGLSVTVPNGPKSFAGSPAAVGFHDSQIQPFVGYFFDWGNFFVQGFEAVDVPTDPNDVTELYNDVAIGYYAYTSDDPNSFIRAIAPVFETHVNVPLNHRGALVITDPAGTADVVDLTFGVNTYIKERTQLSLGFVTPVTGPRPFNYEWNLSLNVYYGRTAAAARSAARNASPPILGQ